MYKLTPADFERVYYHVQEASLTWVINCPTAEFFNAEEYFSYFMTYRRELPWLQIIENYLFQKFPGITYQSA